MIPPFTATGTLPPGIHEAEDWAEVVQRFGGTAKRAELLAKLRLGLDDLRDAGCPWVLLDGSFVTDKAEPNDVDGCWEDQPAPDLNRLDPSFLLRTRMDRDTLKLRYGMDFFRAGLIEAASGKPFAIFFQMDRDGNPRGLVRLNLEAELSGLYAINRGDI